jgi:hypothetical protein
MALRLHASHGELKLRSRHERMHVLEPQHHCLTSALTLHCRESSLPKVAPSGRSGPPCIALVSVI